MALFMRGAASSYLSNLVGNTVLLARARSLKGKAADHSPVFQTSSSAFALSHSQTAEDSTRDFSTSAAPLLDFGPRELWVLFIFDSRHALTVLVFLMNPAKDMQN